MIVIGGNKLEESKKDEATIINQILPKQLQNIGFPNSQEFTVKIDKVKTPNLIASGLEFRYRGLNPNPKAEDTNQDDEYPISYPFDVTPELDKYSEEQNQAVKPSHNRIIWLQWGLGILIPILTSLVIFLLSH
jgi:hypothetical protein